MVATIKGVQFTDVDFTEIDTVAAYEDGLEAFRQVGNILGSNKDVRGQIIKVHECVSDWLDNVFGDGAAEAVFGGKISLQESIVAAADLIKANTEGINEMTSTVKSAMKEAGIYKNDSNPAGQNRAQRRAAQRNKGKTAKTTRTAKIVPQEPEEDDSEQ